MPDNQKQQQGKRLSKIRKHFGYNQFDFADQLGVTQGHLSGMERGVRSLSYTVLMSILDKFEEVNLYWLLAGKGKMLITDISGKSIVQSTPNSVHLSNDLVHLIPATGVEDRKQEYLRQIDEIARRLRVIEQYLSHKFPDFNVDKD